MIKDKFPQTLKELLTDIDSLMDRGYKPQQIKKHTYTQTYALKFLRRRTFPPERRKEEVLFTLGERIPVLAYLWGRGFNIKEEEKKQDKENQ